jgi:hypothetical protein
MDVRGGAEGQTRISSRIRLAVFLVIALLVCAVAGLLTALSGQ